MSVLPVNGVKGVATSSRLALSAATSPVAPDSLIVETLIRVTSSWVVPRIAAGRTPRSLVLKGFGQDPGLMSTGTRTIGIVICAAVTRSSNPKYAERPAARPPVKLTVPLKASVIAKLVLGPSYPVDPNGQFVLWGNEGRANPVAIKRQNCLRRTELHERNCHACVVLH